MNKFRNISTKIILCFCIIATITAVIPCSPLTSSAEMGNLVIYLDPGHGGYDPGAGSTVDGVHYNEKTLTLKISKYVQNILAEYPGVTVLLTRNDNDTYLTLGDRVSIARKNGAHALVSIHANSSSASSANGVEILVPSGNYRPQEAATAKSMANKILSRMAEIGIRNRGTVTRMANSATYNIEYPDGSVQDYYGIVQRCIRGGIAGIIIETAFLSNDSDVRNYLSSDAKLEKMAQKIAAGIVDHYGLSKNSTCSIEQKPKIDAVAINFDNSISRSLIYPQKGATVSQSENGALVKAKSGTQSSTIYVDYYGMTISADKYKYAVLRMRSTSEKAKATIYTGAYEVYERDTSFMYQTDISNELQSYVIDMSDREEWCYGVNFVEMDVTGTDSYEIESLAFYESKSSIPDGKPVVVPIPTPSTSTSPSSTPTPTKKPSPTPTTKPTPSATQKPSIAPATSTVVVSATPSVVPTETTVDSEIINTKEPQKTEEAESTDKASGDTITKKDKDKKKRKNNSDKDIVSKIVVIGLTAVIIIGLMLIIIFKDKIISKTDH